VQCNTLLRTLGAPIPKRDCFGTTPASGTILRADGLPAHERLADPAPECPKLSAVFAGTGTCIIGASASSLILVQYSLVHNRAAR
jgi:hypothetical protein